MKTRARQDANGAKMAAELDHICEHCGSRSFSTTEELARGGLGIRVQFHCLLCGREEAVVFSPKQYESWRRRMDREEGKA
jgi:hypothetical protein